MYIQLLFESPRNE